MLSNVCVRSRHVGNINRSSRKRSTRSGNEGAYDVRPIVIDLEARFDRFVLPLATILGSFRDIHRASKDWVHSGLQAMKLNAFNDLTGGTEANASKSKHR